MYPQGYFHQHISAEGWQEESYERLNWADAPIEPALTPDGKPCITAVPLGDRSVLVAVWRVRLGRVTLYLLDTSLEENAPWDRELTARLYGGDRETRIQQEIILGIGGVRALKALGIEPGMFHLNEGHAGFVVLQRIRDLIEHGASFDDALAEIRKTTMFTTHTPVPAGHDAFPFSMVEKHLASCWGTLGVNRDRFLALGSYDNGGGEQFNMTALAIRSAGSTNAVSQLHGARHAGDVRADVARRGGSRPAGVVRHERRPRADLDCRGSRAICSRRISAPTGSTGTTTRRCGKASSAIPDEELWAVRQSLRRYLFTFIRERARQRWVEERVGPTRVVAAGTLLEPEALTIGFARRFAGYKRSELVFRDPDRLARILNAAGRPVQIIFAGKAHPADDIGKHHLQHVYRRALDPQFGGRIAFVDDYDLHVAHFLVQGCDVWLNNPRKPLEASGTSGMKAAMNGVPHLSIGDGWWAEGFTGTNGWVIDGGAAGDNPDAIDAADAEALYRLLEEEVVPAFYDRDRSDVPHRWLDDGEGSYPHRRRRVSRRDGWSRSTRSGCTRPALEQRRASVEDLGATIG